MPEQFIHIRRMIFRRNGAYDFKYYLTGDPRSHRNTNKIHLERSFTEPPPKIHSVDHLSNEVWTLLNNENRLALPPSCSKCEPEEQNLFWRTFTQTSLESFMLNKGRGLSIDESKVRKDSSGDVINNNELDQPGFIWLSQSSKFALSVGMSRGLTSAEQIFLMGINICKCCLESGTRMIDVLGITKSESILREIGVSNIKRRTGFSQGIIINQIPLDRLQNSVLYKVNLNPFSKIKKALSKSGLEVGTSTNDSFLKQLSSMLGTLLMYLALKDPEITFGVEFNTLPRTYKLFLSQIQKEMVF